MKPAIYAVALVGPLLAVSSSSFAQQDPSIDIKGPTIIAFFSPATPAELKKYPDINESLFDFQVYAGQLREPLAKRGITFKVVYADRFTIRRGTQTTMYAVKKYGVGYCLADSKREPQVQFGVLTDADVLKLADEYFGKSKK